MNVYVDFLRLTGGVIADCTASVQSDERNRGQRAVLSAFD